MSSLSTGVGEQSAIATSYCDVALVRQPCSEDFACDVPIAIEGGPVESWIYAGENVTLNGYEALWYARSRAGADDYQRMERQRIVQEAVIAQLDLSWVGGVVHQYFGVDGAVVRDVIETHLPALGGIGERDGERD